MQCSLRPPAGRKATWATEFLLAGTASPGSFVRSLFTDRRATQNITSFGFMDLVECCVNFSPNGQIFMVKILIWERHLYALCGFRQILLSLSFLTPHVWIDSPAFCLISQAGLMAISCMMIFLSLLQWANEPSLVFHLMEVCN